MGQNSNSVGIGLW